MLDNRRNSLVMDATTTNETRKESKKKGFSYANDSQGNTNICLNINTIFIVPNKSFSLFQGYNFQFFHKLYFGKRKKNSGGGKVIIQPKGRGRG